MPAYASTDPLWNYTTGVEIGIVSLLSWWPYIGAMVRMAPKGRTAAIPMMIGMGAPVPMLSLIGIAGILVLQVSDPADWMRTIGGPVYGVIALLFVAAANLGTAVAGVYASAIGLRHFPGLDKMPWPSLLLLTIAPVVLVGLLHPGTVLCQFRVVPCLHRHGLRPALRHPDRRLLSSCASAGSISARCSWAARAAPIASGAASTRRPCWRWRPGVGPISIFSTRSPDVSHGTYDYTTATLPTLVVAGLVHIVVTKSGGEARRQRRLLRVRAGALQVPAPRLLTSSDRIGPPAVSDVPAPIARGGRHHIRGVPA